MSPVTPGSTGASLPEVPQQIMSPTLRRRTVFAVLTVAILGWETHAIVTPAREVFPTAWTSRDLEAFGRGGVVTQVFRVGAEVDPLTGVSVCVRGSPGRARIEWMIEDSIGSVGHAFTIVHRGTESIAVDGEQWIALTFTPTTAWNREFRLSLRLVDSTLPRAAVRYSPTGAYPGAMTLNGQELLGDLLLRVNGESLVARVRRLSAAWRGPVVVAVVGGIAVVYHAALFGLLLLITGAADVARHGNDAAVNERRRGADVAVDAAEDGHRQ